MGHSACRRYVASQHTGLPARESATQIQEITSTNSCVSRGCKRLVGSLLRSQAVHHRCVHACVIFLGRTFIPCTPPHSRSAMHKTIMQPANSLWLIAPQCCRRHRSSELPGSTVLRVLGTSCASSSSFRTGLTQLFSAGRSIICNNAQSFSGEREKLQWRRVVAQARASTRLISQSARLQGSETAEERHHVLFTALAPRT